ncbi:MAG: Flp pilus assembly complex ATPase component TadA [Candidatus Omnitrophica bacterium]|nr:Flp pilus assembly complex ATPase component TadA [Candidatus Omnitrophota bacterium]
MEKTPLFLGQILVHHNIINSTQLDQALAEQKKTGELLGHALLRMGFVKKEQAFLPLLAEKLNVELVFLKSIAISQEALKRLSIKALNHYKVFPFKFENDTLTVAMSKPQDIAVLDDLSMMAHARIKPALASEADIIEAIRIYYGLGAETIEKMMSGTEMMEQQTPVIQAIDELSSEASISQFLNQILSQAHRDSATDIHIEPFGDELRIRYRIDGELYDVQVPENIRFFHEALISRIKILSNLNIAEKRLPQDGRFKVKVSNSDLDLRVSFLPSAFGESCVIRLLNTFRLYDFDDLGIVGDERKLLNILINKPHGIIFLTGPTGSGKTTTLYSCLALINAEDTKIITVEDPIEYQLKGIVQIQANANIGLTFATALRSILRNDPDVIMIGEVRDFETAQIAIQMSLTGHLVFSTLHTNDAVSGITRLIDIGIEPYLISTSVDCFIAQRLVRLLCPACKSKTRLTEEMKKEFDVTSQISENHVIYEAVGCEACRMTGYSGRQAICEFLILDEKVKEMITLRSTSREIKQYVASKGMKTLRQHGLEKVLLGLTSPSEVLRVTGDIG